LESRFELAPSYDDLVSASAQASAIQAQLANPPGFVGADGSRALKAHLSAYAQAANDKQGLIERFKTDNAVFRNSMHYLPTLYQDISANKEADGVTAAMLEDVDDILRSILLYNQTGQGDIASAVSDQLADLNADLPTESTTPSQLRVRLFIQHVSVILERKSRLDGIAQELVSVPTTQRLDDLRTDYIHQYERAMGAANAFRLALLAAASVLLACTIFILAKWRRATDALRFQARHDALTGLANRALLQARLEDATRLAHRNGTSVALVLMDLDRFKDVNDTLGHQAGDALLQYVATRLQETLRNSDTVARLGGDEFAILLPGVNEESAVTIVRKVLRALEEPCTIDGYAVDVEASAGIAVAPAHGHEAQTILRRADVAMYLAKGSHAGYAVYSPEQDQNRADRLGLVAELRTAIDAGQLTLHYQPKLDCESGDLAGVEALVRWRHPQRGLVPPDEFIPLAEQTGLIDPLTRWVLDNALQQCSAWRDVGLCVPMAINLSARSLQDPRLGETVAEAVCLSDVPVHWLTLEITESAVIADPQRALEVLNQLRGMGVRVAIDDFGTGYSSLTYLKEIPADDLKIDRSFTQSMIADEASRAIVRATIELGHSLGLRVVAEGIENEATHRALAELNCDEGQGYHIARALPPEEDARCGSHATSSSGGRGRAMW